MKSELLVEVIRVSHKFSIFHSPFFICRLLFRFTPTGYRLLALSCGRARVQHPESSGDINYPPHLQ